MQDFIIPKGDMVMLSPYWAHRNTKYFPDPETFNPVSIIILHRNRVRQVTSLFIIKFYIRHKMKSVSNRVGTVIISRASANAKRDSSNLYCVCMYVEWR